METFDLNQTQELMDLALEVTPEQRDDAWCARFLAAIPNASLASFDPQIESGPDGFPYFQLALPDAGAFTPFSIVHILPDLLQNGVGVVVHSSTERDQPPLWVFTLGDIVSYSLFQDFTSGTPDPPPAPDADRKLLVAVPNDTYFPAGPRAAMGRFMRGPIQHASPKIGLVSGASLRPRQSLMVNVRLADYAGDTKRLGAAMRALTWFVPKRYSVMPLPDDWSDADMLPL